MWAGVAIGASALEVGLLVGLEMAVSVVVRPMAGVLADSRDRRSVAAIGALLYAMSCIGYALAGSMPMAFGAAALGGVGGALLWVTVRAMIGESLAVDSAVYPRLMSWEETGSWVAFVAGLSLLPVLDYRGVFLGCAVACGLGAVALLSSPSRPAAGSGTERPPALAILGRRLRPMLGAVAVTMMAETAIGVLLLLHLQRGFDLEVVQIALVFLPGAIAMSALPERLHAFVLRYGRRRVLVLGSVAGAAFAAGLSAAPNPYVIAALWVLSGVAWAAVLPVQQAVIAEASGAGTGRGLGLYESAALIGGAVGALVAGALYESSSWRTACLFFAAVTLGGAVAVPRAVRRLGVADRPRAFEPAVPAAAPGPLPGPTATNRVDVPIDPVPIDPVPSDPAPEGPAQPTATKKAAVQRPEPARPPVACDPEAPATAPAGKAKSSRARLVELGQHTVLFLSAQVALAMQNLSWVADLAVTDDPRAHLRSGGSAELGDLRGLVYGAGRIWVIVFAVDLVWTIFLVLRSAGRRRKLR